MYFGIGMKYFMRKDTAIIGIVLILMGIVGLIYQYDLFTIPINACFGELCIYRYESLLDHAGTGLLNRGIYALVTTILLSVVALGSGIYLLLLSRKLD